MGLSTDFVKDLEEEQWSQLKEFIKSNYSSEYILQDKKYFDWLHLDNPFNEKGYSAFKVVIMENRIIGHLGVLPVKLTVKGEEVRGASIYNLMIEEKYRDNGLGIILIKAAMDEYSVLFNLGFKFDTGYFYEKMGWKILDDLNRYVKILDKEKISQLISQSIENSLSSEFSFHDDTTIEEIERFDAQVDDLWNEISFQYPIAVKRSCAFLNWRYANHPYFKYRILIVKERGKLMGYLIFRIEECEQNSKKYRITRILDIISHKKFALPLLNYLDKKNEDEKIDLVDYFSSDNLHENELMNNGFLKNTKSPYLDIPINFNPISSKNKNINAMVYADKGFQCKDLIFTDQWHLTKGDSDKDRPNPH